MNTIGFTTKFYTLWDVTRETFVNEYGRKGERLTATYIKNISKSEQAARAKYPDATVDMDLRGHSSFSRTKWEPMPTDVFPCGQYCGKSIADCKDLGYLYWAVNTNMLCGESRDIAVNVLIESGDYAEYNGELMTAARVAEIERADSLLDEIIARIEETGVIEVENITNIRWNQEIDDERYFSATNNDSVRIEWNKEMIECFTYNGFNYWLPVKAGKAKRIKAKKLAIAVASTYVEQFKYGRELTIIARDFEIVK